MGRHRKECINCTYLMKHGRNVKVTCKMTENDFYIKEKSINGAILTILGDPARKCDMFDGDKL